VRASEAAPLEFGRGTGGPVKPVHQFTSQRNSSTFGFSKPYWRSSFPVPIE
jgi:hypothetical protein